MTAPDTSDTLREAVTRTLRENIVHVSGRERDFCGIVEAVADALISGPIADHIATLTTEHAAAVARLTGERDEARARAEWVEDNYVALSDSGKSVFIDGPGFVRLDFSGGADLAAVRAENERLRAGIQAYLDGDYPNPRQHRPGKCPHGVFFYDECPSCDEAHFAGLLRNEPALPGGTDAQR